MNSYVVRFVWIFIPVFFLQVKSYAYITHNGGSVSGTWAANTTHYIASSVDVPDNLTLTIEPGCVIKFAPGMRMMVNGTLIALGATGAKIVFTSKNDDTAGELIDGSNGVPQRGDWEVLLIYGSYTYDYEGTATLDSCVIRYGGGTSSGYNACVYFVYAKGGYIKNSTVENSGHTGIFITWSYPTITNDTIRNCANSGLYAADANTTPTITGNVFLNNGSYAAYLYNVSLQSYSGNRGSGNGLNGFGVGGTIDGNRTWQMGAGDFPFIAVGQITVSDNFTLRLAPGTILKFAAQQQMIVYGTINATGNADSNIVFTSLKDDTWGGNTDGDHGFPAAGDWYGIQLSGSDTYDYEGTGIFEYCRFRYGGSTSSGYNANLYFYSAKGGKFETSVCEYSAYYGIQIIQSYPTISGATIRGCFSHGIYVHESSTNPSINNNTFTNNGGYAAYIYGTSLQSYYGNKGSGNGVNGFGIGGTVDGNRTWRMGSGDFPFVAVYHITVADNDTLTLPPGTVLKFVAGMQLVVNGTLIAAGKPDSLIVFTSLKDDAFAGNTDGNGGSPAAGDWIGIQLIGSSTYNWEGTAVLDYCRVRYSGNVSSGYGSALIFLNAVGGYFRNSACEFSGGYGVQVIGSYPGITSDTIGNSGWHGVYVHASNTNPSINNNTFLNNGQYAVYIYGTSLQSYYGNTGSGNGVNGFGVGGTVDGNRTWSCGSATFPFVAISQISVSDNYTLTLSPGLILKFAASVQLYVNGTLHAIGTADSNIVFTSLKDDSYGGNTDGNNGNPAPGDWYGLYMYGNYSYNWEGTGEFYYCRVRYGGNINSSYGANVYFYSAINSGFYYGYCEYSAQDGINLVYSYPSIRYSAFNNNVRYGIYITNDNTNPSIQYNTFTANGSYGAYIYTDNLQDYVGNGGSGNGVNAIGVMGTVSQNRTWSSVDQTFSVRLMGSLNVNGGVTLTFSGGKLDCNTQTISGGGTFTLSSGAVLGIGDTSGIYTSSNNGNIQTGGRNFSSSAVYVYQGAGNQYTGNGLPSPLYGAVEVNNAAGLTLQKALSVNGLCWLTAGSLNLGSNTLNIYGTMNCDTNVVTGTGNFVLNDGSVLSIGSAAGIASVGSAGNIQNVGTRVFPAGAKYLYAGRTAQSTGSGLPASVSKLAITNANGLTLTNSVTVADTLFLTAGGVSTGANTVTAGLSAASPGIIVTETGRIIGNIKRWIPSAKLATISFPVGTASNYRTADITFSEAPASYGSLTASFSASNPGTAGMPLNDNSFIIGNCGTNGYWTLTAGDGLSGGTYNLDLTAEGFGGVRNPGTLRIVKRQPPGSWTLDGAHAAGTGTTSAPVLHRTGMMGFGEFGAGGGADNPLGAKVLNLTALIHGFYRTETGTMISDTIAAYLRNMSAPYLIIDSSKGVLSANGSVALNFDNASNEVNYYLMLKHRNSLETWSSAGAKFSAYLMNYNFTDDAGKAFGNNQALKGTKWCVYNGDLNQDGIVDYSDLSIVDNDSYNFVSGYVVSDVTGDDFVDYSDVSLIDNNQFNFISAISPLTAKRPSVQKLPDEKAVSPSGE